MNLNSVETPGEKSSYRIHTVEERVKQSVARATEESLMIL